MRGLGNSSVGVEMSISAAKNVEPARESAGMIETLAMSGRVVPLGPSGIRCAVRVEVFSWMVKRMSSAKVSAGWTGGWKGVHEPWMAMWRGPAPRSMSI
jgi:hypothetical protein